MLKRGKAKVMSAVRKQLTNNLSCETQSLSDAPAKTKQRYYIFCVPPNIHPRHLGASLLFVLLRQLITVPQIVEDAIKSACQGRQRIKESEASPNSKDRIFLSDAL